jgi:hypothetical protein
LFCGAYRKIKKGIRNGVIRYKCRNCGKSASSPRRKKREEKKLWNEYVWDKQTRPQLARKTNQSTKTVERKLDRYMEEEKKHRPRNVTAIFDATYFGKRHGVLVVRDPNEKENLHCHEIYSETKAEYQKGRDDLEQKGYALRAVVLDGRRGIPSVFRDIPVQICHFHQWQIVKRKLTTKPKLEPHQVLLSIGRRIAKSTEKEMRDMLIVFEKRYRNDLLEKTYVTGTKRWRYTHAKLRSAYKSLVYNLPNLYISQKYPELKIPNTTNSLDGFFNVLKMLVNVHRGLRPDRRLKLIKSILKC